MPEKPQRRKDFAIRREGPRVLKEPLPPLHSTRGLRYDEMCVHLKCSIDVEGSAPFTWNWYVLEGQAQPDGDWLLWGFVSAEGKSFAEFTLSQLEAVAKSWGSKITFDSDVRPKILSQLMENLGVRWHNGS
jgi:hypothetical protein